MELLQWHKVCEIGGDKLQRPPMVALKQACDITGGMDNVFDTVHLCMFSCVI